MSNGAVNFKIFFRKKKFFGWEYLRFFKKENFQTRRAFFSLKLWMRCKARSRIVIRKGAEKFIFSKKRRENMKAVTHCIFDLDGLLQDTEERLAKLLDQKFKKSDRGSGANFRVLKTSSLKSHFIHGQFQNVCRNLAPNLPKSWSWAPLELQEGCK